MNLVKEIEIGEEIVTVHSNGDVYRNGNKLKQANNGAGYLSVLVGYKRNKNGKLTGIREYIHRLVAKCFIDNPENLPQVNHKDFNKSNNDYTNLEWVSRADNIRHSHENGRMQKRYDVGAVTVLTKDEVIECYTRVKSGEGVNAVAISMGKPRTTISSIINKRSRTDITDAIDNLLSVSS